MQIQSTQYRLRSENEEKYNKHCQVFIKKIFINFVLRYQRISHSVRFQIFICVQCSVENVWRSFF